MTPGRSSTQCSIRQENTASKLPSAKGSRSYSLASAGPAAVAIVANSGAGSACSTVPVLPVSRITPVSVPSWLPKSRQSGKSRRMSSSLSAIRMAASRFRKSNPEKPAAARVRLRRCAVWSNSRGMDGSCDMAALSLAAGQTARENPCRRESLTPHLTEPASLSG